MLSLRHRCWLWQSLVSLIFSSAIVVFPSSDSWATSTSLLGIEVDGCVAAVGFSTPCAIPPVSPIGFTELTATVVDPGVEFTQLAGNVTADFDDTSETLTALGGVLDLRFVFASNDWTLQNVALRPGGNLGVISLTLDSASNSFEVITENTVGNFLHMATFDITAEAKSAPIPEPSTMFLFGAGLAGLAAWRYRKSVNA